jgi:hypothetical protein
MSIDLETFSCHTPNCPNEARSRVGRYSYCDHCRTGREQRASEQPQPVATDKGTFAERVSRLNAAAKTADRLRAVAVTKTRAAMEAKKEADKAADAVATIAREFGA